MNPELNLVGSARVRKCCHLFVCLFVCLSVCLFFVCGFVGLCMCVCVCAYASLCVFVVG